jgi:hypothetical protein
LPPHPGHLEIFTTSRIFLNFPLFSRICRHIPDTSKFSPHPGYS